MPFDQLKLHKNKKKKKQNKKISNMKADKTEDYFNKKTLKQNETRKTRMKYIKNQFTQSDESKIDNAIEYINKNNTEFITPDQQDEKNHTITLLVNLSTAK